MELEDKITRMVNKLNRAGGRLLVHSMGNSEIMDAMNLIIDVNVALDKILDELHTDGYDDVKERT